MSHLERVVVLVDMDCFYCQVEENLNRNLRGKPIAVVQYNAWRGGGIIAVNYPARDRGVTRHMRGKDAKEKCPEIILVTVPNVRGKADLTKYREAGKRVAEVLQSFTTLLERASVDEAYLDITESVVNRMKHVDRIHPDQLQNTHIVGHESVSHFLNSIYSTDFMNESEIKLAWGGVIAEEIRSAVFENTGYKCSAGVAHNKILAKLVAGIHKPNQQTILPHSGVPTLFEDLPVRKIRSLGGKFGNHLSEKLGLKNMAELYKYSEKELAMHFDEKTANWLYNIARGIDNDPVTIRLVSKSIGCCKKFPGRTALTNHENVKHWLNELAIEISERLEKDLEENNRKAKQMVINFAQEVNKKDVSGSRSHVLNSYDADKIASDAYEVVKKNCLRSDDTFRVKFLGISVGKFEDVKNVSSIASFFNKSSDEMNISRTNVNELKTANVSTIASFFNKSSDATSISCTNVNELKTAKDVKVANKNSIASFLMNYANSNKNCNSTFVCEKFDDNSTCDNQCKDLKTYDESNENVMPGCSGSQFNKNNLIKRDDSTNTKNYDSTIKRNKDNESNELISSKNHFNKSSDEMNISRTNINELKIAKDVKVANKNSIASFLMNSNKNCKSTFVSKKLDDNNTCENQCKDLETYDESNKNVMPGCSGLQFKKNNLIKCDDLTNTKKSNEIISPKNHTLNKCDDLTNTKKSNEIISPKNHTLNKCDDLTNTYNYDSTNKRNRHTESNEIILSKNHTLNNDLNSKNSEDSNDSITEELQPSLNPLNTSSFFNKYMEKLESPAKRHFDTSQNLEFNSNIDDILDEEIEELTQNNDNRETNFENSHQNFDNREINLENSHQNRQTNLVNSYPNFDNREINLENSHQNRQTNLENSHPNFDKREINLENSHRNRQTNLENSHPNFDNREINLENSHQNRQTNLENSHPSFDNRETNLENSHQQSGCGTFLKSTPLEEMIERNCKTPINLGNSAQHKDLFFQENNSISQKENSNHDGCQLCPECNKRVPFDNFVSHMDYHFAIKIVRSEVDLYKPVKIEKTASPKKSNKKKCPTVDNCMKLTSFLVSTPKLASPKKSNKRKCSTVDNCMKLTSFLVSTPKVEDDSVLREICSECDKSVPLEEFASHVDYHVAKRIHLEINNFNKGGSKADLKKCDSKISGKKSVKVKKDNAPSIVSFFKPV